MRVGVYTKYGDRVRDHCRTESPGDIGPAGDVTTVGGRDRAAAGHAAADGIEAPAGAARGWLRGIDGGRATASVPAATRTSAGAGRLAGSVSAVLVGLHRCPGTPPRPHG